MVQDAEERELCEMIVSSATATTNGRTIVAPAPIRRRKDGAHIISGKRPKLHVNAFTNVGSCELLAMLM